MSELHPFFQHELFENERILWAAQPNNRFHFSEYDIFLIPFAMLISTPLIVLGNHLLFSRDSHLFRMGALMLSCGICLTAGRYFIKWLKKSKTYYLISNLRIIILRNDKYNNKNTSILIKDIDYLDKKIRKNGNGTIRFKRFLFLLGAFQNVGLDFTESLDSTAFYDIDEAEKVYGLLVQLINKQQQRETHDQGE